MASVQDGSLALDENKQKGRGGSVYTPCFLEVILACGLVLGSKKAGGVFAEPLG